MSVNFEGNNRKSFKSMVFQEKAMNSYDSQDVSDSFKETYS